MRNHPLGIAFALAIILICSSTASSQTKHPSKASTVPASAQARDLSGVWMQDRPRPATVRERYWIYEFTLEEPPMTGWGEAQYKATKSSFGPHPYPLGNERPALPHLCSARPATNLSSSLPHADRASARRSHHAFRVRLHPASDFYRWPPA